MKKSFLAMLAVLCVLSTSVFAAEAVGPRPQTLRCRGVQGKNVKEFTIDHLNTKAPALLDLDASENLGVEENGPFVQVGGNNGCDDNYDITFSTNDLRLAAAGKLERVRGLMNYFDSDLQGTEEALTMVLGCEVVRR